MIAAHSIRPASEDDAQKIAAVESRVHKAPWSADSVLAELKKSHAHVWVVTDDETDEEVYAYIVFVDQEDAYEILNVAVDLPHRGTGLGQTLVRKVVSEAIRAGRKRVILNVRKSNTGALELYQKQNFTVRHVRKAFYSDGEDAYEMAVELDAENVRI